MADARPPGSLNEEHEPIMLDGDRLHDAAIALDHRRWTCRLCGRQAMHADGSRGYGVMHTDDCFLVTTGVIRNRNRRGVALASSTQEPRG